MKNFLIQFFTWWNGQTLGTRFHTWRKGERVGEDEFGNVYYQGGKDSEGRTRRWVIYNGEPEGSRVPADWHVWLHRTFDENPGENPLPHKPWEKPHVDNLTGTALAYAPAGSLRQVKPVARSDYEAWQPE